MNDKIIEIINNPKKISGKRKEKLTDKLLVIARDGFGTEMIREDVAEHAFGGDALYLMSIECQLAGFASYNFLKYGQANILHLNGIAVRRNLQKNGTFRQLNKLALDSGNFDFLTMRTQNPVVYEASKDLVLALYPWRIISVV